jgi:Transposase zinc-ribbon domain
MPTVALPRLDLPFPGCLPEFQRLFPDDTACAAYVEAIRWRDGFVCGWCGKPGEPYRCANRPQVLRCRKCQRDNALTAGTVMERTHTPLSVWFWAAYLVSTHTPGMSAVQFQRQLGLKRYETAFQILHKLRAGMVRPDRDRIGADPRDHVEIGESWVGGRTRGAGRGVHDQSLVVAAVEVRQRKPENVKGRAASQQPVRGRIRMAVVPDRSAASHSRNHSTCGVRPYIAPPATRAPVRPSLTFDAIYRLEAASELVTLLPFTIDFSICKFILL